MSSSYSESEFSPCSESVSSSCSESAFLFTITASLLNLKNNVFSQLYGASFCVLSRRVTAMTTCRGRTPRGSLACARPRHLHQRLRQEVWSHLHNAMSRMYRGCTTSPEQNPGPSCAPLDSSGAIHESGLWGRILRTPVA
ncbi:hypothetical protein GWK47_047704 [Chionoecetes opilio]|uniref:Uncharacterized protein n=1 Tax=Chionoecetes opilio TaxID=41210 RepID=A0A8J4Y3F7_CHIOP|nr:hypothetical protein GWK47_047704 [Chionoecetes opilio]